MNTIKDESFGVVPIRKTESGWEFLLVEQISYRSKNDRFWTFPKGHQEAGETPQQTAKRELAEETNITAVELIESAAFTVSYSFRHEGKRIEKTVTYYLGLCTAGTAIATTPEEIAAVGWFSFSAAQKQLVHETAQTVLRSAEEYIKTNVYD